MAVLSDSLTRQTRKYRLQNRESSRHADSLLKMPCTFFFFFPPKRYLKSLLMIAYVILENNSRKNKEFLRKSENMGGVTKEYKMNDKILIVEDDKGIVKHLTELLIEEGYAVEAVGTKQEALLKAETGGFSLVLIDLTLPDGNGYTVCTVFRQQKIPVIFLTAADDEASVVTGFQLGAEDYVTKPFRAGELLCRIRLALHREKKDSFLLRLLDVEIDILKGTVKKKGEELFLTALEYRLLLVFAGHPKEVLTRERLLNEIWDAAGEYVNDNTLTVYIKRIREKIEDDVNHPTIIQTVRGIGYKIGSMSH